MSAMSLSRALTKRIGNRDKDTTTTTNSTNTSGFSLHIKRNSMGIKKGLISSPVELISTTNSLVHTAPAIGTVQPARISTTIEVPPESGSPPPLTPDNNSSDHDLPSPPATPPPSHNDKSSSPFSFGKHSRNSSSSSNEKHGILRRPSSAAGHRRTSSGSSSRNSGSISQLPISNPVPIPSHILREPTLPRVVAKSISSGALRPTKTSHPFGKELAQVTELAEEMGLDLDEECMVQRGLYKFTVEDYLAEVQDVVVVKGLFGRKPSVRVGGAGWI